MSFRLFEGKSHAKVYKQFREQPPQTLIDRIIAFLREKYSGPLHQAVDLGCGSGQCTYMIAKHFDHVLGTDISPAQIEEANEELTSSGVTNVSFRVSPAEKIPLEDGSVQLITICTAAHWMDLPKVYEEAKRALCPGGVLALFCTDIPTFKMDGTDEVKNEAVGEVFKWVDETLMEYFAAPAKMVIDRYQDVQIPFKDFTREEDCFVQNIAVNLSRMLGLLRSYSGFQNYCVQKGNEAGEEFLNQVKKRLVDISGIEDMEAPAFIFPSSYFLLMARV